MRAGLFRIGEHCLGGLDLAFADYTWTTLFLVIIDHMHDITRHHSMAWQPVVPEHQTLTKASQPYVV